MRPNIQRPCSRSNHRTRSGPGIPPTLASDLERAAELALEEKAATTRGPTMLAMSISVDDPEPKWSGIVGCAKSPCEVLRLDTDVMGDFAHAVEFSGSLPRAQNRAGYIVGCGDIFARDFAHPTIPRLVALGHKQKGSI